MDWQRSPSSLVAALADAMKPFACDRRVMFGYPAYFVNGNMFVGLHGRNVVIRLGEADRAELLASECGAVPFEPMPGRTMKEYAVVPAALYEDASAFEEWLDRSYRHALSLPPKQPKKRKS